MTVVFHPEFDRLLLGSVIPSKSDLLTWLTRFPGKVK
jgi:hypothetical protein